MRIEVVDFLAGARHATGTAVVIDVFRAFSTACYAVAAGARVVPVGPEAQARALGARHPDWLLAGERDARDLPGFHFGNSPSRIAAAPLRGRTLVHTTHAGTQGLTEARAATEVVTGSLVNAAAIVRYLKGSAPAVITLVRMGRRAAERCVEDDLCAELLIARLTGREFDTGAIATRLRAAPSAAKFFDPAASWAPEADFELCAAVDRFDFVLRLGPPDSDGVCALERHAA